MTELTSQDFSSEAFVMNMAVPCHFVVAMASGDNEERTNERTNGVIHTRLNKNSSIAVAGGTTASLVGSRADKRSRGSLQMG